MDIVIYLYNGVTALDAIGPYEVLSRLPDVNVKFVAKQKGKIITDTRFLKLIAEYDILEVEAADILLVPGSTAGFMNEIKDQVVLSWLQKLHKTTRWTTSVCSGSIILGAAGLLESKKATSHWAAIHLLQDYGSITTNERYVQEGKIVTAQGVSAGIDMSLFLADQIVGEKMAKAYQLLIEYDPKPPFSSGNVSQAEKEVIELCKMILMKSINKELEYQHSSDMHK